MKDYQTYSYWLETCGDDLTPRPALNGVIDADIAILGAGYSGLWTAYYLLKQEPTLRVTILEREIAGFGASGRNGAWCTSGFPSGLERMSQQYGREQAVGMHLAMVDAVNEVGRVAEREAIDIQYHKGGMLMIARGPQQEPAIHAQAAVYERFGFGNEGELLDRQQTMDRIAIAGAVGSLAMSETAVIHPGRLVRGLARLVERMGATILEQTNVTRFTAGTIPVLHTAKGEVRARTIVLCGEAYMALLPGVGRQLLPVYSLITLTESLSASD